MSANPQRNGEWFARINFYSKKKENADLRTYSSENQLWRDISNIEAFIRRKEGRGGGNISIG